MKSGRMMRRSIQLILVTASLLSGIALVSTGCDRSCHGNATCRRFSLELESCPEDPVLGHVGKECGVWVSASTGDDEGDGTQEAPLKTLSHAIELAAHSGGPRRVYACGGTYSESLLVEGVSIFGGFYCDGGEWEYVGAEAMTEIEAPPVPAALVLLEHEALSVFSDIRVAAGDGAVPGGSSIAVLALPGSRAVFRRVEMIAGRGADGADGADGSHDQQPAMAGLTGNDGVDACSADLGAGGPAVTAECIAGTSVGGQGGNANDLAANDGLDGLPGSAMDSLGLGAGGHGENAARGTPCTPGIGGAAGQHAPSGTGAAGRGRLTSEGYVGAMGADGGDGLPGQGGGGGGASLGSALCAMAGFPTGGAGGGSGGSGGCGGRGGKGGQAGGSSIGLGLLSQGISLLDVVIRVGDGGNGGNGGFRQQGGQGGLPGQGGFGAIGSTSPGCAGGVGGKGGDGGDGGGGRGGHSAPIAATPGNEAIVQGISRVIGEPGKGGMGGQPPWNSGTQGDAAAQIELDL